MKKILIVEDEIIVSTFYREILKDCGYELILAQNGLEGCKMFKAHEKDIVLVLLDIVMPEMNGTQLAQQMNSKNENIPIVVISGHLEDFDIEKELGSKNIKYIFKKPIKSEELEHLVLDLIIPPNTSK